MDKVQKIEKAKKYLTLLAQNIDPITLEQANASILEKTEIQNCLIFVTTILDDIIKNNGEVIQVTKPLAFHTDSIDKSLIKVSNIPIGLDALARNVNTQIDVGKMKKLTSTNIRNWLVSEGYLNTERVQVIRNDIEPKINEKSKEIGIIQEEKVNQETGEVKTYIKLTKQAQEYIINNLEAVADSIYKKPADFDADIVIF